MVTFQEILRRLALFWEKRGCIIHQGYDLEGGAGTFNPATFLRCLGPEPYSAAYIEPCRRPTDGRYGTNPNRLQHYFQYQVVIKPSPLNVQDLYLESLKAIGFDLKDHDIRFVHDDWESPTLGAWGLGWEVWMDGMEITQFTYFQSVGSMSLKPITAEITYGIERIAMYLQNVDSIFDIQWSEDLTYGDLYHRSEIEWSYYNFEHASTKMWLQHFEDFEQEAKETITNHLPLPAYDFVMKASHAFNILDARGAISVSERTGYIGKIRDLARSVAEGYVASREKQSFPLLKLSPTAESANLTVPGIPESLLSKDKKEDFLLEIGSEELPATFVKIGCANLEKDVRQILDKAEISFDQIKVYGTPRRLAIYVKGLAMSKPAKMTERRGPSIEKGFDTEGKPTTAVQGFFRSIGKEALSLDAVKQDPQLSIKNDYLFASIEMPGQSTARILAEELPKVILNLDFPKKMRWADLEITYARPLRWIVALFGSEILPFAVGNLLTGRESSGHRQRYPGTFSISHPRDYVSKLKDHFVMVDMEEREMEITEQLNALEHSIRCRIICRDQVIPQVLNLVEWPEATSATFDAEFLKAPKEVLISEMVEHQKYFPVATEDGTLKNQFIIVADTTPTDQIRKGNQKVLSSRLADGVFLYDKDIQVPLEQFNEKLKHVTFLKNIGTIYDKVERLIAHTNVLQKTLEIGNPELVQRSAVLCKADLASDMVFEFPELQGTIGKYYAQAQEEDAEVASAIEEHWMPLGEKSPLPQTTCGVLVSLADKFDNLISCFAADLKPTSSSDPYALRRQALGIIKILIQGKHRLPLVDTLRACINHFPSSLIKDKEQLLQDILTFLTNRIKTVFQDYGLSKDEIEASLSFGFSDIYDAFRRVRALHQFRLSSNQFSALYEVYKRAKGQLNGQEPQTFQTQLLQENAEKALDKELSNTQQSFEEAMHAQNYDEAYELIANMQPALATLFEEVRILADDDCLRQNRIALLQRVFTRFGQLLDFSKIQE